MTGMFLEGGEFPGEELFYGHVYINKVLAGKLFLITLIVSYNRLLCTLDVAC
jgi:hypothetical protein